MVLLSFKFHMNFYLFFLPIVNNSILSTSYFYIFLLVVVALLHSTIACHKRSGINLKERTLLNWLPGQLWMRAEEGRSDLLVGRLSAS